MKNAIHVLTNSRVATAPHLRMYALRLSYATSAGQQLFSLLTKLSLIINIIMFHKMLSEVRTVKAEGDIFSVNIVFVFPWRRVKTIIRLESMFSRFIL